MNAERKTLASLVDEFDRHGSQVAVVARRGLRHVRITYAELAALSRRFASELIDRKIEKGDRVIIWGDNGPEWIAAFFGCVLRGVLPVPMDIAGAPEFVRRVERDVAPRLVVSDADRARAAGLKSPVLPLDSLEDSITRRQGEVTQKLAEDDPLQIVFTSGTTGEPKGVVHTHRNVLASLRPIETEMQKYLKYERIFHPIRFLHTLPLSHVFGQFMGLWIPPLLAAEVHYDSRLVAPELIDEIRRERISVLCAVPRVLSLLQEHLTERFSGLSEEAARAAGLNAWMKWWRFRRIHKQFGLKFWAFIVGGAALPPVQEQFWGRLGFLVVQGYGMTETTALISLNHPFKAATGTIGQVLPGREVRLGPDGEVLVRGETISNAVWQGGQISKQDSDWLATGDLAEFDEQGNLRFRGRKKEVIVTSAGLNIYPEDLESALKRQAGVRDAAVIEFSGEHGPEPFAAVLTSAGNGAGNAVAGANKELAEFQRIYRWIEWPDGDFPRTSSGKVLKREIAASLSRNLSDSQQQEELNLDSLGRVELQARLEQQYGVTLDDAALQQVKTTEDVRRLLAKGADTRPEAVRQSPHTYPHWPWSPVLRHVRAVFLDAIAMPLVRFLASPKRVSLVSQWPSEPLLIVANHVSSYDPPLVMYALPRRIRNRIAVAMSAEILLDFKRGRNQGHWFLDLLAPAAYVLITALFNVFPLPQFSGFRRSFAHAGEAVDAGYSVLVFPEGRRADDERPQRFMRGSGLLWKELRVPALAVRLHGLGEIKSQHSRWFRSGKIAVSALQFLPTPPPEASADELTSILESAVFGDAQRR